MRKPLLFLVAAAIAATPVSASNAAAEQNLVRLGKGGCPAGFTSIANVDDVHVCVRQPTLNPDVYISNTGCPSHYTEVGSTAAGQWVCVTL